MKAKRFNKKLTLNKKTVANLNPGEMGNLKGGTILTCAGNTCPITVCEGCLSLYYSECPNICDPGTFEC